MTSSRPPAIPRRFRKLGRIVGVSEATVRRRLEALRQAGILTIRAVVEP
ncbi:winged helix-turn-helix transcriptional regulator [Streptomyces sp. Agncl-13]